MLKKRKTRELAMQTLFLWDAAGAPEPETARQLVTDGTEDHEVRRAALDMANGTWGQREQIDVWIERLAPQWPPRRQPGVDRNLIRLAVWELTNTDTPPKVVIDEAIELAKQFSTEHSPAFVNGVLDSVLKEKRALTQESGVRSQESAEPATPLSSDS
jgi:N utilization substance protein B